MNDKDTSRDHRTFEVVEAELPTTLRDALPAWALRS